MSRWAPSISTWGFLPTGSLVVTWEVDRFYAESQAPDDVAVEINGAPYKEHLGPQARELQIARDDLLQYGSPVVVSIVFIWLSGTPSSLVSSELIGSISSAPIPTSGVPERPTISVDYIEPATLTHGNRIGIAYKSFSFTEGRVRWGKVGALPIRTDGFAPGHHGPNADYSGKYVLDSISPDLAHQNLSVTVEVRNTLQGNGEWVGNNLIIQSARNFNSLRALLVASAIGFPTALKQHLHGTKSLRAKMQV